MEHHNKKLTWRERSEVIADHYVEYECPETHKVTRVKVTNMEIIGGCGCCGHHGDDEYCYCSSTAVTAKWDDCPECKGKHKCDMRTY